MSNVLVTKYPFTMPEIEGTELLVIKTPTCVNLIDGCWLWNPSVGYLEVEKSDGTDNIMVSNPGRLENAKPGTQFPSCMEFFVDAPTALPTYDPTVTCLAADFISPEVGETGIMVVDDTSHIRDTDIIIIDRQYRYTVVEVLDEHRLLVRNEGDGKEGIIDVKCDECLSVKVLYSTFCCTVVREELQAEIDAINDRLDNKKSILSSNLNNLVSISGGANVQTDAPNDTVIYVDDDLSKYDNSVSKFITGAGIPRGNLTVSSTGNVLTINSGSGSAALLKDLNINLDLSAYATSGDIPSVGNGRLTIKNSDGTTLGTFTANQSGNSTITLPAIPTPPGGPSQYSGQVLVEHIRDVSYTLENTATSGDPISKTQSLTSDLPTINIASPVLSGHNIIIFGTVFVMVTGTFHTDTHTYPDQSYHSFVTVRGPVTNLYVSPSLNSVPLFSGENGEVTSGRAYHISTDVLGTTASANQPFSQQLTIPVSKEVVSGTTNTLSFTGRLVASGLRNAGGSSSQKSTFYNEGVKVFINKIKVYTSLGWVIK